MSSAVDARRIEISDFVEEKEERTKVVFLNRLSAKDFSEEQLRNPHHTEEIHFYNPNKGFLHFLFDPPDPMESQYPCKTAHDYIEKRAIELGCSHVINTSRAYYVGGLFTVKGSVFYYRFNGIEKL